MRCPACNTVDLTLVYLESNLPSHHCTGCEGHWVSSSEYETWLKRHGETLPEKPFQGTPLHVPDHGKAKLCPECGRILIKYGVWHGLNFTLEQCGHCHGVWFDKNEWESLKQRNLHDEVHKVFTASWQTQARKEERKWNLERIYLNRFGSKDYMEIKRIREWICLHPRRQELLAFLNDVDPYDA
jgi:Zn-finger nucleic acid-binding protein